MKRTFTYVTGLLLLLTSVCQAQERTPAPFHRPQQKCSTIEYMRRALAQNPALAEQWRQEGEHQYSAYLQREAQGLNLKVPADAAVVIPIVFHLVDADSVQSAISDRDIYEQVEILNRDYSGAKAIYYKDVIPSAAFSRVGNVPVKFVLAKRTPAGIATNGIERRVGSTPSHIRIKATSTGGLDAWDVTKYLNVWVGTFSGAEDGLLGIATFPFTTGDGAQGVVIGSVTLPVAGNSSRLNAYYLPSYSEGATLAHEIGHYFYLFHTFGDDTECNNNDFDVQTGWPLPNGGAAADDTPEERESDSENIIFGNPSMDYNVGCEASPFGIIYGSYMNYYDDRALFMFTNGQKARVVDCINLYRAGLLSSDGATPVAGTTDAHLVKTSIVSNRERIAYVTSGTPLTVTVRNSGSSTITSLTLNVAIDGGTATPNVFPVALTAGNEITLSLPALTAAAGTHLYTIYSSNPNGGTDQFHGNDTLYSFVYIDALTASAPLTQDFTAATFPPTNWVIWNPNGNPASTWARSAVDGFTTLGAAAFYNYNIQEPGTMDDLVSPAISFGSKDSSLLTFRVAHGDYTLTDVSEWDGLEILVSGDEGSTYNLVYKKTGDKLRTISTVQTAPFVATPLQPARWRRDSVNLSPYMQAGKKMIVVFRNTNAYGNNTFLDDINITAEQKVVLPLSLLSFTGTRQNNADLLKWQTASETGTREFVLETSTDGNVFTPISTLTASRSGLTSNYDFSNHNLAVVNFYRLRIVDMSGRFTYSNTVKLSGRATPFSVYPAPAKELVTVSGLDNKGDLQVLAADGRLMLVQPVSATVQTLNISRLAKGVYFVRYTNGGDVQIQKIIKE